MTALLAALLLDSAFGEPRWLWSRLTHPAILMGRCVNWLDTRLNHAPHQKAKGIGALLLLILGAGGLGLALAALPGQIIDIGIAAILLAQRSLSDHVRAVAQGLYTSTGDGRAAVAMIVSRDTGAMDTPAVARSAIESAAENLSDGVVAPAFWFLILGLPGLLIYKAVNTADSMIGYRTPRHENFGWAAARFDDLLNLIPARLTAALIWLTRPRRGQWRGIIHDARLHRSPNAGWPEAAMARVLGVSLAGPRSYDGTLKDFAFVNPTGARNIGAQDIDNAVRTLWQTWALMVGLLLAGAILG
ncbi:adenosylcobinamide-phosphate synthase CbiB [Flavimaricola marinus]|uniref:Cobalamin biosynthesis protein CobD n=1 Tax=Flavimaricola marinus TaxID=1819565 RepID=A0A238L9X0_9RHOB|nr:adenosylcobinamide-phosphate synthase CbiB [Flavimaricola marinus]SMY06507.1 cobalamin biosynthesis protein [Flavimaricola marinus]